MKTQKYPLILFTILIVFNACSIEKKHASFGYHIEWRSNKFLNGNKAIAQKTKPKTAKEKTIITPIEIDLILESKANSVEANSSINNELVSTSNEIVKFEVVNKTKTINSKQQSIIKKSKIFAIENRPTKNIFSKQSDVEMPILFYLGCILMGIGVLSFIIGFLSFNLSTFVALLIVAYYLLILGIAAIVLGLLIYLVKFLMSL